MKYRRRRKRSLSVSDNEDDGMMTSESTEKSPWPPLHSQFPRCSQPPRREVEEFAQSEGIKVKFGPFDEEEDETIRNNFKEFCDSVAIEDDEKVRLALLGFMKDEKACFAGLSKEQMNKVFDFKFCLAKSLDDRLIGSVYQRARKILAPFGKIDVLSESEKDEFVKTFHERSKPYKYVESALEKKVDPKSLRRLVVRKVDSKNNAYSVGKWSPREEKILLYVLRESFPSINDVYKIKSSEVSWVNVSRKIETRCPDQCRNHFIFLKKTQRPFNCCDESFRESDGGKKDEFSKILASYQEDVNTFSSTNQDHDQEQDSDEGGDQSKDQDQDQDQDQYQDQNQDQDQDQDKDQDKDEDGDPSQHQDNKDPEETTENCESPEKSSEENEPIQQEGSERNTEELNSSSVQRDMIDEPENRVSTMPIESNEQSDEVGETEDLNHPEEQNSQEDDRVNIINENGDAEHDSFEGVFTQINEGTSFDNSPSPVKAKKKKRKKKKMTQEKINASDQNLEAQVETTATEVNHDPLSPQPIDEMNPRTILDVSITSPRKRKRKKHSTSRKDSNETSTPLKPPEKPKEVDQTQTAIASQGSEWGVKLIKSPEINKQSKKSNRKRKKASANQSV